MALTLGERGALIATLDEVVVMPALPVRVVSAVGAGDSFLAALIWALARGSSAQDALAYGLAAGAAAVLNAGTVLARAEDIMRFYCNAPKPT